MYVNAKQTAYTIEGLTDTVGVAPHHVQTSNEPTGYQDEVVLAGAIISVLNYIIHTDETIDS